MWLVACVQCMQDILDVEMRCTTGEMVDRTYMYMRVAWKKFYTIFILHICVWGELFQCIWRLQMRIERAEHIVRYLKNIFFSLYIYIYTFSFRFYIYLYIIPLLCVYIEENLRRSMSFVAILYALNIHPSRRNSRHLPALPEYINSIYAKERALDMRYSL